jgi:hypothetical protein
VKATHYHAELRAPVSAALGPFERVVTGARGASTVVVRHLVFRALVLLVANVTGLTALGSTLWPATERDYL